VAIHRIYIEAVLEKGELQIGGEEAHHAARVKRVRAGDRVEVLDGRGRVGNVLVARTTRHREGWRIVAQVEQVEEVAPVRPRIEVYSPAPKGARLSEAIDGLSQVGAALWAPLSSALSVDASEARLERVQRIATEASKQCGRAWLLEVGSAVTLADLLAMRVAAGGMVMADVSGEPYRGGGADVVRVLVGPEGGWREDELAQAREAGVPVARFGPHVMRIETAVVAATAIVLDVERRG
jgi:16S rRNA (uracil1498-N3)-methyltransferase